MNDGSLRVALLARAGDACDRIGAALREAGADVVLVADPADGAPDAVRDARPQAIMVALEPAIEDALDAFDELLADPAYLVIFEEAELAAQRAGWDAARWLRHLAAKLHRHGDVLPPGAEEDLQPSPGPLPMRRDEVDLEEAIAVVTDEAQQLADEVPRDSGIEGAAAPRGEALSPFDPLAWETGEAPLEAAPLADDASSPFDPVAFELDHAGGGDAAPLDVAAIDLDFPGFATGDETAEGDDEGLEALVAALEADEPGDADDDASDASEPSAATAASEPIRFDTGGLSLADDDAPLAAARPAQAADPTADFEDRFGGLSLADPDSYGHGPERGAVLVEAGLGGPDAVRQLLAAIPAGFPRTILVRLQLDGGRYDRLVRQMERAAALPVQLATADAEAAPGQVYFLPPELGLRREKGLLRFDEAAAGQALPEVLPPADSALLLLSGASRRIADAASAAEDWSAALVAGQAPDGSYDPDAALALLERGGTAAPPTELAAMLAQRWPPPGAPAPDLEELQP
jgi:chemosensory pili system protein ChpB (putative protein-glutamate methylesterase)